MPLDAEEMSRFLQKTNKEQEKTIADLRETVKDLRATIANLQETLDELNRKFFGTSSEKTTRKSLARSFMRKAGMPHPSLICGSA
jgi:uncharacterized coiled-coil protein SlyX